MSHESDTHIVFDGCRSRASNLHTDIGGVKYVESAVDFVKINYNFKSFSRPVLSRVFFLGSVQVKWRWIHRFGMI